MASVLGEAATVVIEPPISGLEPMNDAVPGYVEDEPTARVRPFVNRFAAGRQLSQVVARHVCPGAVVLGIGRGGTAVAHGVAQGLGLPFDMWLVRRLVAFGKSDVVLGVISEGTALVLDPCGLARSGMTLEGMQQLVVVTADHMALEGRRFRRGGAALDVAGRTVFLVADGIPADDLVAAAIAGVRKREPARVVVAAPVGAEWAVARLASEAHAIVCLMVPPQLQSVGVWYQDFPAITDSALMKILAPTATLRAMLR